MEGLWGEEREREEDTPTHPPTATTFTAYKLPTQETDLEFSRTMQLLWDRRSRDVETLCATDVRVRHEYKRSFTLIFNLNVDFFVFFSCVIVYFIGSSIKCAKHAQTNES